MNWVVPLSQDRFSKYSLSTEAGGAQTRVILCCLFVCWLYWVFAVASPVWDSGLVVPEGCGILVPWLGIEPAAPVLEGRFSTSGPPGSPKPGHSSLWNFNSYFHLLLEWWPRRVEQSFIMASESWEVVLVKTRPFSKELACRGRGHSWCVSTCLLIWEVTEKPDLWF